MYFKKSYKVQHYLTSKLNRRKYQKLVQKINHPTLSLLFKTISQVENSNFDNEDRIVFEKLQAYRNFLDKNNQIIDYSIFGIENRIVSEIYQSASSSELWSQFHYLLTKNFNAKNYLEIGTNLGVSGSYILSAIKKHEDGKFITMEGAPKLCEIAEKQFLSLTSRNQFQIIQGLYQNTMPEMYAMPIQFDMAFIDGNHKYDPTLEYFLEIKKKIGEKAILIFDDIYNTDEMKNVWNKIIQDPEVNFSIDLYKLGIVILDKTEKVKGIHTKYFLTR